ncbi:MMPL family RND transporter [Mycobacterium sp. Y57]|nr:MMPL family RND transporter [Mycolicibacterium xanthum]MBX7431922.1 MMPL family RND transporter [Mycolicibacterium xanthum]
MFRRADSAGALTGVGFDGLAKITVRHPWIVIALWLVGAAALVYLVPSLAVVAERNPPGFLPADSVVMNASDDMQAAFQETGGGNVAIVVLSDDNGLDAEDEATYRTLVERLRADTADVLATQDFVAIPEIRDVMTGTDGKAWQLPVSAVGEIGSAEGQAAYRNIVDVVDEVTADSSLQARVIGPAATFDDVIKIGEQDQHIIEAATILIVLTILLIVYRNVVAMLLPLLMMGVALVVAQGVVAALGDHQILSLGPQTLMLMTAMMMGAATDYGIFLFSRYHECIREGLSSDDAVIAAMDSIGKVIAGSAGTTAVTFFGLAFTQLAVFSTVGPALSVTILIAFVASVSLLPAMLTLAGRRGWVKPRKDLTSRWWRTSGVRIVRKPAGHLAASLVVLLALAACAGMMKFNYDDRKNLPADASSNLGYAALDEHFPVSTAVQQFILVQSPHDLRTPKALADMEQMAFRVSQVPDIEIVRGVTRPTGEKLEVAKATYQAGEVGSKLGDASKLIDDNDSNLSTLSGGAHQLADALAEIRSQVVNAIAVVRPLTVALANLQQQYGGTKTLNEIDKTAHLVANMRSLGDSLGVNLANITDVYGWAAPVVNALNVSPVCDADPRCVASRADLQRIVTAKDDGTLDKIADLGRQLQNMDGTETLDQAVRNLGQGVEDSIAAARKLGLDDPRSIQSNLNQLQQGANQLSDSSRQLAEGVQLLVDQTRRMGEGLDQASAFLLAMKRDASDPQMSGFYIPPEILTQEEFKKAAELFVSPDGHVVRYLVQTALNPFGTDSMDQVAEIVNAAQSAQPNTSLADAKISLVGFSSIQNELRNYYNADIQFIIILTLLVVFLILAVLLRSLVAPVYLVLSVVLSYLSALGIGVVFFQFILGQEIMWSVPGMAFLVLVAVGADYNLLLIARIRDESKPGMRTAVIRTVGATGSVITSAGLIFAASMFGLTFSSLNAAIQIGFVIGVGLLLDTFVVRTVTVPATAVLIGKFSWWPGKPEWAVEGPAVQQVSVSAPSAVATAEASTEELVEFPAAGASVEGLGQAPQGVSRRPGLGGWIQSRLQASRWARGSGASVEQAAPEESVGEQDALTEEFAEASIEQAAPEESVGDQDALTEEVAEASMEQAAPEESGGEQEALTEEFAEASLEPAAPEESVGEQDALTEEVAEASMEQAAPEESVGDQDALTEEVGRDPQDLSRGRRFSGWIRNRRLGRWRRDRRSEAPAEDSGAVTQEPADGAGESGDSPEH